jgi:pilus assembly protein CpaE
MRALFFILSDPSRQPWAEAVAQIAAPAAAQIFVGLPSQAAQHLATQGFSPSHIVMDIGSHGQQILPEVDILAEQCEPDTRVIAVGDANDVQLYRGLISRGVIDYLPMPANPADLVEALRAPIRPVAPSAPVVTMAPSAAIGAEKRVITFLSAASGDGASTAALNTAYAMSQLFNGTTVLVDMDYQFGMVAKHLSLQNQYGIRDLFDHPERGIDGMLIKRMVANYGKLHVVTAPAELRYLPSVSAEAVRDLVNILKQNYDNIIIDLPHVWLPWVATACQQSTHLVLVAQLWLKSVSHAARMMRAFREINVPVERVHTVINRSGAKFKEAIEQKDFERVCGSPVRYTLNNDIKTIVAAEAAAQTVMEMEPSALSADIMKMARGLAGLTAPEANEAPAARSGLFARFNK